MVAGEAVEGSGAESDQNRSCAVWKNGEEYGLTYKVGSQFCWQPQRTEVLGDVALDDTARLLIVGGEQVVKLVWVGKESQRRGLTRQCTPQCIFEKECDCQPVMFCYLLGGDPARNGMESRCGLGGSEAEDEWQPPRYRFRRPFLQNQRLRPSLEFVFNFWGLGFLSLPHR